MKPFKFLLITLLITLFALIYVWQQTEIFRLAYKGEKKLRAFDDLLDKNTNLRYNIKKSVSLVRIGERVSESEGFQIPSTYQLVKLARSNKETAAFRQLSKKENIVSRLFGVKRQAEAKTVSPSTAP